MVQVPGLLIDGRLFGAHRNFVMPVLTESITEDAEERRRKGTAKPGMGGMSGRMDAASIAAAASRERPLDLHSRL